MVHWKRRKEIYDGAWRQVIAHMVRRRYRLKSDYLWVILQAKIMQHRENDSLRFMALRVMYSYEVWGARDGDRDWMKGECAYAWMYVDRLWAALPTQPDMDSMSDFLEMRRKTVDGCEH